MDKTETISALSTNRLSGQPVPKDLAILFKFRSKLLDFVGLKMSAAADWQPWKDTGKLTAKELARNDVLANLDATTDMMNCISFVAVAEDSNYLGYWHGPEKTPIERSPIVWLDNEGQFNLLPGRNLADAVICYYAYDDDESLAYWKSMMTTWGIDFNWSSIEELPEPGTKHTPSDVHKKLFYSYLDKLHVPKPWWRFW